MIDLHVLGKHVDAVTDVLQTLVCEPMYPDGLRKAVESISVLVPLLWHFRLSVFKVEDLLSSAKEFAHALKEMHSNANGTRASLTRCLRIKAKRELTTLFLCHFLHLCHMLLALQFVLHFLTARTSVGGWFMYAFRSLLRHSELFVQGSI